MAITGTGTQADPYIVTTWSEIMEKIAEAFAYVKCAPGLIFDMNEMFPSEAPVLDIICREFDGNGVIIKNGRYTGNVVMVAAHPSSTNNYAQTVKNLQVINFFQQGSGSVIENGADNVSRYQGADVYFYDCVFSGESSSSANVLNRTNFIYNTKEWFYRCGFNIKYTGSGYFVGATYNNSAVMVYEFNDCHIIYEGGKMSKTSGTGIGSAVLNNSLFEGSVTSDMIIGSSSDSIMNVTATNLDAWENTSYVHILYNSSKIGSYIGPSGAYTGLTDTELQDVQAVAATGFPIGGTS